MSAIRRRVSGTVVDERRFINRPRDDVRKWLHNANLPHRRWLAEVIVSDPNVVRILEVGCGWGPNLSVLADSRSNLRLFGIDISPASIAEGAEQLRGLGYKNIVLREGQADNLEFFGVGEMDVVFTDAVLLYVGPDKIRRVLAELCRVARRRLVLLEMHKPGVRVSGKYTTDGWLHDYKVALSGLQRFRSMKIERMPCELRPDGRWPQYGSLIDVSLHDM